MKTEGEMIRVCGYLKNEQHKRCGKRKMPYEIFYRFGSREIDIQAEFPEGKWICPVISRKNEEVNWNEEEKKLEIQKPGGTVLIKTDGRLELPHGRTRIFNLVPGFQALKICICPEKEWMQFHLSIVPKSGKTNR